MRILVTSNASYAPPRGGSTRSNLAWLQVLAQRGHACRVICAALDQEQESNHAAIEIRSVPNLVQRRSELSEEIRRYDPDWVLVSSEDLSHMLLREAAQAGPHKIVYLAHTPQFFPFGPESWNPDSRATAIVRTARAVVAIGHWMAGYIQQHAGVTATVVHPPVYGDPPFARFDAAESGWVLMINPSKVKGIGIFTELARRFPEISFAALAGWATSAADREALAMLKNVRVLESVPKIEDVLSRTRILLVPSLWLEGFGLIAMQGMLHGIPVISSDSGGLQEARDGTGFVVPVERIQRYLPEFDEMHMPRPVIPEQNLELWAEALASLIRDNGLYRSESERCHAAALRFVAGLDPTALEKLLCSLAPES